MRILVVSDTHGHENNLERVLKKIRKPDHLIHCGDVEGHQKIIRQMAGCPCTFVRGNNDFFTDLQISEIVEFGKYRIYVTHGHLHGVSWDNSEVLKEARENGCNVVMYGHTHVPVLQTEAELCGDGDRPVRQGALSDQLSDKERKDLILGMTRHESPDIPGSPPECSLLK